MSVDRFTLLADGAVWQGEAELRGERVLLAPDALRDALGFELKPEGLCRGPLCVPVRDRSRLTADGQVDLAELARLLGRPLAVDLAERAAALGEAAADQAERLGTLEAADFELPDVDGKPHRLSTYWHQKVLLHAFASW